jgi:hypothetical protein
MNGIEIDPLTFRPLRFEPSEPEELVTYLVGRATAGIG